MDDSRPKSSKKHNIWLAQDLCSILFVIFAPQLRIIHTGIMTSTSSTYNSLRRCLLLLSAIINMILAQGQSLQGRVMLSDSVPAVFATVYIPATGQGATTDYEGNYLITDLPRGVVEVEYAHLGYQTLRRQLQLPEAKRYAHDERLTEQPIQLNDIFITPDGKDPAIAIFDRLTEQAKINRSKAFEFDASMRLKLHCQDMDIVPDILPGYVMTAANLWMRLKGVKHIFGFAMEHPTIDTSLKIEHQYRKGRDKVTGHQLLSSQPNIPQKAVKELNEMAEMDLFDLVYGKDTYKQARKHHFRLKGIIEEDGKVIDVLESTMRDSTGVSTRTLYVVEGDWALLRAEYKSRHQFFRLELREVGDGIYLPISLVNDPKPFDADQIAQRIIADPNASKFSRKVAQRIEQIVKSGRHPHPCTSISFTIAYKRR